MGLAVRPRVSPKVIARQTPPRLLGAASIIAASMLAVLATAIPARAAEMYDSGWAVAPTPGNAGGDEGNPSVLNSPRVPIGQIVPKDDLEKIVVPPKPRAKTPPTKQPAGKPLSPALTWRPRTSGAAASQPSAPTTGTNTATQKNVAPPQPAEAPKSAEKTPAPAAETGSKARSEAIADAFELPGLDDAGPKKPIAQKPDGMKPGAGATVNTKKGTQPLAKAPAKPSSPPPADDELREPAPFPGFDEPAATAINQAKPTPAKPTAPPADVPTKAKPAAPIAQNPAKQPEAVNEPEQKIEPEAPRLAKRPTQSRRAPAKTPPAEETPSETPKAEAPKTTAPKTTAPNAKSPATPDAADDTPEDEASPDEDPAPTTEPEEEQPRTIDRAPFIAKPELTEPLKPLSRSQQYLRRRLRSVLSYYYRRPLNSRNHDPWEVMHGMLAYGLHSRIQDSASRNKPVTAIGYLCFNKPCKRKRLLRLTPDGEIDGDVAYGLQGHKGQFLAMLAQCNVSPDYPIKVDGKDFTIVDLILSEQRTCFADTELTFKLIGLMHYLDSGAEWFNEDGERWDLPRLIYEERNQKIRGAACGGTHRLSGLSLAAKLRVARGEPLDGEFLEAQRFTEEYQRLAFRLQNRDGSLSTEWFRGPGDEEDINRRVRTTGHLLEWLLYSLPDEKMTDYKTVRAVNYLTSLLAGNTENLWEIGPLSHALHALALYDERVFRPHDIPSGVVKKDSQGRTIKPTATPNYRQITSRVYSVYPSAEEIKEAQAEAESGGGLRALFGIGGRSAGRRSR